MRLILSLAVLATLALAADGVPVVPYDSLMEDRVSVDGYVEREDGELEYPATFVNQATGMTVSWGYDDSLIYVALETRGKGWFGVGFGAAGMNESNMVVGFYNDDSAEVYCLVGKGYTHKVAAAADALLPDWDIDFDDETGVTILEFTYPLHWRGEGAPEAFAANEVLKGTAISGLEPGDTYDITLAQNTKTPSLAAKHTHRTTLKFQMAEKPEPAQETGGN